MPPDPGVMFFLFLVGMIMLAGIAYAVLLIARWNSDRIRYVTPRVRSRALRSQPQERFSAVSREETNEETEETTETPQRQSFLSENILSLQQTAAAEALARLIIAGELDLTKAVKIGMGKKSGAGYQKASQQVKAAIERQKQPEFPTLEASRRPSVVERS